MAPAELAPGEAAPEITAPSGRTYRSYAATALMQVHCWGRILLQAPENNPQTLASVGISNFTSTLLIQVHQTYLQWWCAVRAAMVALLHKGYRLTSRCYVLQAALDAIEAAARAGPEGLAAGITTPSGDVAPEIFAAAAGQQ